MNDVELAGDSELKRISAVRTAATWMRSSGKPLSQYPKRDRLSDKMRHDAEMFAAGLYPWPSRWTVRLFEAATRG